MKRILSLTLCLCMLFTFCMAQAELQIPTLDPSQEELQAGFLFKLLSLVPGLDLDQNALHIEATQADQSVLEALLQQADGVFDVDVTVAGVPVHAQFTGDALLVSYEDGVYRLTYQDLLSTLSAGQSGAADATAALETLGQLFMTFYQSAILTSITTESDENNTHIVFDLTEARMAESLVALGDAIVQEDSLVQLLAAFGITDVAGTWAQLRGMIEDGQLPISLHADITVADSDMTIEADGMFVGAPIHLTASADDAEASYQFDAAGFVTVAGRMNVRDGGYEYHVSAVDGTAVDAVFAPSDDGWTYSLKSAEGDTVVLSCEAALTESALDASLACMAAPGEDLTGSLHFDRATKALTANLNCPESMGGMAFDLTGEATDTGYHLVCAVSRQGVRIATVDAVCTVTEALVGLEITVTSEEDEEAPETLMYASFAYATATGAFTLHYEDIDEVRCEAKGVLTENHQSFTMDVFERERQTSRTVFDMKNDARAFSYGYTIFSDTRYDGHLNRLSDISVHIDKTTGTFRASYEDNSDYQRLECQGILADGLFTLRLDDYEYGRLERTVDIAAHWDDDVITADFSTSDGYTAWTGNLLRSDNLLSLTVSSDDLRFEAALEQDRSGMPTSLNVLASDGRYQNFELRVDERGIVFRNGERSTYIKGFFKDQNTYCIDIASAAKHWSSEIHTQIEISATDDGAAVKALDEGGNTLFEVDLKTAEKTGFDRLDSRDDIVEMTPELIAAMLQGMVGAEEAPEPEADLAA